MYKRFGKRILDITIAVIGLVFLSPLFLLITILLYFLNQGKPFFLQPRPGLNERIFTIVKFRTMQDQHSLDGSLGIDSRRISKFGSFLRKTSLDEMPQLWNVLKGDMSLIGPRPLLTEYLPFYNPTQQKRHLVKPGITGWAQVRGRNAISWAQKFDYDVYYVQNISFCMDVKIMALTLRKLLLFYRIAEIENVIPEKFAGKS